MQCGTRTGSSMGSTGTAVVPFMHCRIHHRLPAVQRRHANNCLTTAGMYTASFSCPARPTTSIARKIDSQRVECTIRWLRVRGE